MTRITRTILAVCLLAGLITGCTPEASFDFDPDGISYSSEELVTLASEIERPAAEGLGVDRAQDLRHDALVGLRKQGGDATKLADFLTQQFSSDSRAVPFWGAAATVNGRSAWVVAEVWGSPGGSLTKIRIWAFDRDSGDVIASAIAR